MYIVLMMEAARSEIKPQMYIDLTTACRTGNLSRFQALSLYFFGLFPWLSSPAVFSREHAFIPGRTFLFLYRCTSDK